MKNRQLYKDLLQMDGQDKYIRKMVEELTELQLALLHWQSGKSTAYDIAVEIADVKIQLEKALELYGLDQRANKHYNDKVRELEDYVYHDPNFRL